MNSAHFQPLFCDDSYYSWTEFKIYCTPTNLKYSHSLKKAWMSISARIAEAKAAFTPKKEWERASSALLKAGSIITLKISRIIIYDCNFSWPRRNLFRVDIPPTEASCEDFFSIKTRSLLDFSDVRTFSSEVPKIEGLWQTAPLKNHKFLMTIRNQRFLRF